MGCLLLRWDLSPSSKHLHCASGFGDAQRDHRDGLVAFVFGQGKKIYFLCISSYGECVCVSSTLNIEPLDVQNVQWNPSVAIPAAVSVRGAPSQTANIWGLTLPRGIVLSTTATYQLIKKKESQLPEVRNALDWEMKMPKNFPRYLAHCLFLQILYGKINPSFSALWDVPINTLSIYRVRSLGRNRCCNLSVGLCF